MWVLLGGGKPLFPVMCGRTRPVLRPHFQATAEAEAKAKAAKAEAKRLSAAEKLRSLMHWSEKLKEMLPKEAATKKMGGSSK